MPNQYNARDLANVPAKSLTSPLGDGYPIPSASGIGGGNAVSVASSGFFPVKSTTQWTAVFGEDAAATLDATERRPKPSASGIGGGNSVAVAGAFNGGVDGNAVIDRTDAPFNTNIDPFLDSDV